MDDSPVYTATAAKQRFGEVLERAARGPVGIERHGRIVAYVVPPGVAAVPRTDASALLRARQLQTEKDARRRRDHVAFAGAMTRREVDQARLIVDRWEAQRLCSHCYIEAWRKLLALPRAALRDRLRKRDDVTRVLLTNSPLTPLIARRRQGFE